MSSYILVELMASEQGVTTIEYALMGSLIAVVILGSVTAIGGNALQLWTLVSGCVTFAVSNVGSCS